MDETFEYSRLHIMLVGGLSYPQDRSKILPDQVVTVHVTQGGPTLEYADDGDLSLLQIVNRLGEQSWMIPEVQMRKVEQNAAPNTVKSALMDHFGIWGHIQYHGSQWLTRRIVFTSEGND